MKMCTGLRNLMRLTVLALVAPSLAVFAADAKPDLKDIQCAMTNTKTMCLAQGLVRKSKTTAVVPEEPNALPDSDVSVYAGDDQWRRQH
ncbi:MAG: hypothetical protein AAFU65_00200 [Pseudomonadota bacterium]